VPVGARAVCKKLFTMAQSIQSNEIQACAFQRIFRLFICPHPCQPNRDIAKTLQ